MTALELGATGCSCRDAEVFRVIPGYAPYMASTHGRILNGKTDHILKLANRYSRNEKHYLKVDLGRRAKNKQVHRLVAMTFLGMDPVGGSCVCHIDDDGLHNCPGNLEWGSHRYNQKARVGGIESPAPPRSSN